MKNAVCSFFGVVGGFIASLFGGWSVAMTTLVICMAIDYITGIIVAGIFHNSHKTETGSLESRVGWKGLIRKGITLIIVLLAYRLDLVAGTAFIKDAVCIAYISNEILSILENAGLMGVPIPKPIIDGIEILKHKGEHTDDE